MTSDSGTADQLHNSAGLGAVIHSIAAVTSHAFMDFHPYQEVVPSAGKDSTATCDNPALRSSRAQRSADAAK
jgi:hypothetical protein